MRCLGDDPTPSLPALARGVKELLEAAHGLAGDQRLPSCLGEFIGDPLDQALVARQAEHVIDPVGLAPRAAPRFALM